MFCISGWLGDRIFVRGMIGRSCFLWMVGRSPLREKLVNILTVQKSYKNYFILQHFYPYPVIT
nr:hypothetical protein [Pseudanabaena mucicola]